MIMGEIKIYVKLDLDSRVKAIRENFFKSCEDHTFFYQIEMCLQLQKKCLKANRFDLAEDLANIVNDGLNRRWR